MTTPNEELISMLRAKGCPDWVTARWLMESAANLLQSQAERIAGLEKLERALKEGLALACIERDTLRAELAAIAATEPIAWVTSKITWTNHQSEQVQKITRNTQPAYNFIYLLFTRPMPTQSVDAELVEALQEYVNNDDVDLHLNGIKQKALAALFKYKGAK